MINDVRYLYGDDKASEQYNRCASRKRPVIYTDEKGSISNIHTATIESPSDDHLIISNAVDF
jgi:hypothetical protein